MRYTISEVVGVFTTKQDGTALMTKTGKPYKKATVKFNETENKFVGMMVWDNEEDPKVGDVLEGEVKAKEWNGKTYHNFDKAKAPSKTTQLEFKVAKIENYQRQIIAFLKEKFPPNGAGLTDAGTPVPTFEANTPAQAQDFEQKMTSYENEPNIEPVVAEDIPF